MTRRGRNHRRRTSLDDLADVLKDGIEIFRGEAYPFSTFSDLVQRMFQICQTASWYGLLT